MEELLSRDIAKLIVRAVESQRRIEEYEKEIEGLWGKLPMPPTVLTVKQDGEVKQIDLTVTPITQLDVSLVEKALYEYYENLAHTNFHRAVNLLLIKELLRGIVEEGVIAETRT